VDDVAVLDEVVLSFHAHGPPALGSGLRAVAKQLVPADHLGLDEAALEVGVDDARRLGGTEALADHPGAAFVLAHREVALQPEERESLPDQLVQAGLGEPDGGEEVDGKDNSIALSAGVSIPKACYHPCRARQSDAERGRALSREFMLASGAGAFYAGPTLPLNRG